MYLGGVTRGPTTIARLMTWNDANGVPFIFSAGNGNGHDVLLKMDLDAGHFSASDRYKYLKELSFDYAWLLKQLGKNPK